MMKASVGKLLTTALAAAAFMGVFLARPGPAAALDTLDVESPVEVGQVSHISFKVYTFDDANIQLRGTMSTPAGFFASADAVDVDTDPGAGVVTAQCYPTGIGTQSVRWRCPADINQTPYDIASDQTIDATWLCTAPGTVTIEVLEGGSVQETQTLVCGIPSPANIQLTASPPSVSSCPASVRIQAKVVDLFGDSLPDGTLVNFASTGGTLTAGFAYLINGIATTTLEVGNPPPFSITVLATSSGLQKSITINVSCPAVPLTASKLTVSASQTHISCGSRTLVTAFVTDQAGNPVPDGLVVKFIASSGTLDPAEGKTVGGAVTTTYTGPATPAIDLIQAAAGPLFESVTIFVECTVTPTPTATPAGTPGAAGSGPGVSTGSGTASAGAQGGTSGAAGAAGGTPSIRPPSTGDGGLAAHRELRPVFALSLPLAAAGAFVLLRRRSA